MGRIATAAIITLALAGATVQSFAGSLPFDDKKAPAPQASVPSEALFADVSAPSPPAPSMAPDADQLPPPPPGGFLPGAPGGQMRPGPMGWGPGDHMREMAQTWGLLFDQKDKNLSDSDVQALATAILLIHGNHTWKVADVADAVDGSVTFAFVTADGSVVARFAMDRHSGRLTRIG